MALHPSSDRLLQYLIGRDGAVQEHLGPIKG